MNTTESAAHCDAAALPATETEIADCIRCSSERAVYVYWQTAGNTGPEEHWSIHCPDCGFQDADSASSMQNDRYQPA